MVREALDLDVVAIVAVGTAGLRAATNRSEVINAFRERTGITVTTITGEEEGRLAYLAAIRQGTATRRARWPSSIPAVAARARSASTRVDERFSLPVGAVRYASSSVWEDVGAADVLAEARAAIDADLARIDGRPAPDRLIAMGGVVSGTRGDQAGLATYDPDVVNDSTLDRARIGPSQSSVSRVGCRCATDDRRDATGPCRRHPCRRVRPSGHGRLDSALTVCDRGLRHGLLNERFGAASGVE